MRIQRDFTYENLQFIKKIFLETKSKEMVWQNLHTTFPSVITRLFFLAEKVLDWLPNQVKLLIYRHKKNLNNKELQDYYETVCDEYTLCYEELKNIFFNANDADLSFAERGRELLQTGEDLVSQLEKLIEIATPTGILTVGQTNPNESLANIPPTSFPDANTLSDIELEHFCKEEAQTPEVKLSYMNAEMQANAFIINDIDTEEFLLIALFKGFDIGIEKIVAVLLDNEEANVINWIASEIANGNEKFLSAQEIADRLGCDVDDVLYYLVNSKPRVQNNNLEAGSPSNTLTVGEGSYWKGLSESIDRILAEQALFVTGDVTLIQSYCDYADIDPNHFLAKMSTDYDPYIARQYKTIIGDILGDAGKSAEHMKQANLKCDIYNKFASILSKTDSLSSWEEKYVAFSQINKNGIVSEIEARDFLKKYGGYDSVSDEMWRSFKSWCESPFVDEVLASANAIAILDETGKLVGDVSDFNKKFQKLLNTAAYLTADYTQELELLDGLIAAANGDSSYRGALYDLRTRYTDKVQEIVNESIHKAFEKVLKEGTEAALETIPGVKAATILVDIVGSISGATSHAEKSVELLSYVSVCDEMRIAYNTSIQNIVNNTGNLDDVRYNFVSYKSALTNYYSTLCEYYDGTSWLGLDTSSAIGKSPSQEGYARYMLRQIEDWELGKSLDYISFAEYEAMIVPCVGCDDVIVGSSNHGF